MTRDELILKAQQVRARNSFPPATEGELAALPAEETLFHLETAGHTVPVYRISPKRGLIHHCPMIINFHGGGYMKGRFDGTASTAAICRTAPARWSGTWITAWRRSALPHGGGGGGCRGALCL